MNDVKPPEDPAGDRGRAVRPVTRGETPRRRPAAGRSLTRKVLANKKTLAGALILLVMAIVVVLAPAIETTTRLWSGSGSESSR